MRRLLMVAAWVLVALGMWVVGITLSEPPPEIPGGAAHALTAPVNPQNGRVILGIALIVGGGFGAWLFGRR